MDYKPFEKTSEWKEEKEPIKDYTGASLVPDEEVIELHNIPHTHFFIRKTAKEFGCRDCHNGWIGTEKEFEIKNGTITSVNGEPIANESPM